MSVTYHLVIVEQCQFLLMDELSKTVSKIRP